MHERHGATAGGKRERLYSIWRGMLARCYSPTHDAFPYYGSKGVRICDDWRESFTAFRRWALANGYKANLTIDRLDDAGHYEPTNCRWATGKMQARHKGPAVNHIMVTHAGKTLNLFAWAQDTGLNYTTLRKRYLNGDRPPDLLRPPRRALVQIQAARVETKNGKAKLTAGQVQEVISSDETGRAIAQRFGVSPALVSMIRSRQRRSDLT